MAYGASAPILDGVVLRRPNAVEETPERVGAEVTLAGGANRRYSQGTRQVFALHWSKLDEAERAVVIAAAGPGSLTYVHGDGATYVVLADAVGSTPVAGTDPVRFAVDLTLREQAPSS